MIIEILSGEKKDQQDHLVYIESQIKKLKISQSKLLDLKLDETIGDEVYLMKHNQLENEIKDYLDQKARLKSNDILEKTGILFELAGSLCRAYFRANKE